ncbi:GNAT family N-acetyltransferase [Paludibacterium purpuratum]|uniref:Acetyltransferase (GNAT) family protein n=1 Tax=Paludibacterium purpuratum TaxID=1144873 RepID=A0A4R7AYJ3_9NEIS|nr:GNAT family N-acetyltransferase [Paludibacterium purpuratum]TDR72992.1 acetyltransferase (GNAT) family protein [Paludibacterium purpuratum]
MNDTISIKEATSGDWPTIWTILEPTFRAGETYSLPQDITSEQARQFWMETPAKTFVCFDAQGEMIGTYFLKANQPGQGNHVGNCGYVVSPNARGLGAASAMCLHSQDMAVAMGFRAMQFNLVVSTNAQAVRLWRKLGFLIVGTLPDAFKHPTLGYVDAFVMYKHLIPG